MPSVSGGGSAAGLCHPLHDAAAVVAERLPLSPCERLPAQYPACGRTIRPTLWMNRIPLWDSSIAGLGVKANPPRVLR